MNAEKILEFRNVTKIYDGGVLANHNVNFSVVEGEIHALVGENGAGKSTLMKMLFGIESITSGQFFLRGEEKRFNSSRDALNHGIGMVHQHFMLVDDFTAAENLVLNTSEASLFVNKEKEIKLCKELSDRYGFDIIPDRCVRDMSVGMKQKLEILKMLYRKANIIILDEPTAVLTPQETDELFEKLIDLKRQGMTIIFISHKLDEVKQISDRVTVLRAGRTIDTVNTQDISTEEISNLMVGRDVIVDYSKTEKNPEQEILRAENLFFRDPFGVMKLRGVSLNIRDSEIVGVAGVEGNGQSELISIIAANLPVQAGKIYYKDHDITHESIGAIRRMGVSFVPEDRMVNGCAAQMSVEENLIASNVDEFTGKMKLLSKNKIKSNSQHLIRDFDIKTDSENRSIKSLSGGNIQKVIVAREFTTGGDLLLLEQPTRGIDVGAISFIHRKILEMREQGCGILIVSADLDELISLCDRILVMYQGEIVANLDNSPPIDEKELGLYMLGLKRQEKAG